MMNIPNNLNDEIWGYCRLNKITNIDDFMLKMLKQGFTVEKYIHKKTFDEIFLLGMEDVHEILNIKSKLKTSGIKMKTIKID